MSVMAKRALRAIPFVVVAGLSVWVAGRAPHGRKPFHLDLSLSPEAIANALMKVPHLRSIATLFLLAVLALGVHRLWLAFAGTMVIGASWELLQTTVVGHNARVADMAPNLVAALATLVMMYGVRSVIELVRHPRHEEGRTTGRGTSQG